MGTPVVLVCKKDGSLHFCVDYHKVNNLLPPIDETLKALSGAKFFRTLDLISGYWQVGLTPQARLKSAFCVRSSLYLRNIMPFKLTNSPFIFERLIESGLCHHQWKIYLIYLDDIDIFSKNESELLDRIDMVFSC